MDLEDTFPCVKLFAGFGGSIAPFRGHASDILGIQKIDPQTQTIPCSDNKQDWSWNRQFTGTEIAKARSNAEIDSSNSRNCTVTVGGCRQGIKETI